MRLYGLAAVAALSLLTGCSKNAEAEAFIKENDALVADVAKATTPADARKAFDARKDALGAAYAPLKEARGFQISAENTEALTTSLTNGATKICMLQISAMGNKEASDAYKAICDDYSKTFGM